MNKLSIIFFLFISNLSLFAQTEQDSSSIKVDTYLKNLDNEFAGFKQNTDEKWQEFLEIERDWGKITLSGITDQAQYDAYTVYAQRKEIEISAAKAKSSYTNTYILPIQTKFEVSSNFGSRLHPIYKALKFHYGVDLKCPENTPVNTIADGFVLKTGFNKGYGNFIRIKHDNEFSTVYAHLNKIEVSENQEVNQGDIIGLVGKSGMATTYHLHFEIVRNKEKIDPKIMLKL